MNDCSKILHFMTILGELRDYSKTIVLGNIDYKKYLEKGLYFYKKKWEKFSG